MRPQFDTKSCLRPSMIDGSCGAARAPAGHRRRQRDRSRERGQPVWPWTTRAAQWPMREPGPAHGPTSHARRRRRQRSSLVLLLRSGTNARRLGFGVWQEDTVHARAVRKSRDSRGWQTRHHCVIWATARRTDRARLSNAARLETTVDNEYTFYSPCSQPRCTKLGGERGDEWSEPERGKDSKGYRRDSASVVSTTKRGDVWYEAICE